MKRHALGITIQAVSGLPLLTGALSWAVIHEFSSARAAENAGQLYVFLAPATAVGFSALAFVLWCLRWWPFDRPVVAREVTRVAWAAIAGLGIGGYAGLLSDITVFGGEPSSAIAYFAVLPLALLACLDAVRLRHSVFRLVACMGCMEVSAQLGHSYSSFKRLTIWDEISYANAIFLASALVAAAILVWVRRLRPNGSEAFRRPPVPRGGGHGPRPA